MAILRRTFAIVVALLLAATVAPAPASAAPVITITFVRHAESQANASGLIDTSVPGPSLDARRANNRPRTPPFELSQTPHDGIYASSMIRTQQTAQPLADELGQQIVILPGLREIEAGDFEGQPERDAGTGYLRPLEQWLKGDRNARIPGSIDGNEFDARFDEAVDAIYRSGQQRPVAFSHGAAIAMWTMMNVRHSPLELAQSPAVAEHRARPRPGQSCRRLEAARLEWHQARLAQTDDFRGRFWSILQSTSNQSPGGTVTEQTATALPPVVDQETWQHELDELRRGRRPPPANSTPSPRSAAGCRWSSCPTTP